MPRFFPKSVKNGVKSSRHLFLPWTFFTCPGGEPRCVHTYLRYIVTDIELTFFERFFALLRFRAPPGSIRLPPGSTGAFSVLLGGSPGILGGVARYFREIRPVLLGGSAGTSGGVGRYFRGGRPVLPGGSPGTLGRVGRYFRGCRPVL